jgi:hypothetical protein
MTAFSAFATAAISTIHSLVVFFQPDFGLIDRPIQVVETYLVVPVGRGIPTSFCIT